MIKLSHCVNQHAKKLGFMVLVFSLSIAQAAWAANNADPSEDYAAAQQYIAQNNLNNVASQSMDNSPILQSIQQQTPADQQQVTHLEGYQGNPDSMNAEAAQNPTNQVVTQDIVSMPTVQINPNSDMIKNAQTVQTNATSIASGTYKDCQKTPFNKTTYVNKTCDRPQQFDFTCDKTIDPVFPDTPVVPTANCEHLAFNINGIAPANSRLFKEVKLSYAWIGSETAYIYLVSGVDANNQCYLDGSYQDSTAQGTSTQSITIPAKHSFSLHNVNYLMWDFSPLSSDSKLIDSHQKTLVDLVHATSNGGVFDEKIASLPALDNDETVTQSLLSSGSGEWWAFYTSSFLTFPKEEVPAPTFQAFDQCANSPIAQSSACSESATPVCKDNAPRTYNGKTYAQCWDLQSNYHCGGSGVDDCSDLVSQGCDQLSSTCSQLVSGVCTHDTVTYSCPVSTTQGDALVCGDHIYCLDGTCQATPPDVNQDFGQAATQLSAVNSAGSDVASQAPDPSINPKNIQIFSGQTAKCRDMALGVMNCCQDSGWAKGIITNCKQSEINLGLAKQKGGLVVYVGEYCSYSILGICTEHSKAYCQFPSKMATDVQIGGRAQLGENFGSPDTPNCVGFTPDQVQKIDFSKIDFSNVVADTENNTQLPSNAAEQSAIAQAIARKMQGGGQ